MTEFVKSVGLVHGKQADFGKLERDEGAPEMAAPFLLGAIREWEMGCEN